MKKELIYVGIGPRSAGEDVLEMAKDCGTALAEMGWTLRSGGAEGMDEAFERGCDKANGAKEIYIPSADFRKRFKDSDKVVHCLPKHIEAMRMLLDYVDVKAWESLATQVQMFLVRNVFALAGEKLDKPADCVITWNMYPDTGSAYLIGLAEAAEIPVFNLRLEGQQEALEDFVQSKTA